MKEEIDPLKQAGVIAKALRRGVTITAAADGRVNPMTIGWGALGIDWAQPVFIAYVRLSRFTHGLLDKSGEFTVNVPDPDATPQQLERAKQVLAFCGSKSGRDLDKVAELGLTLTKPQDIATPGILELPLTLECRVIYRRDQDVEGSLEPRLLDRCYPQDAIPDLPGAPESGRDIHTAYYGQILSAYIER